MQCSCMTKKGHPCPNHADRERDGVWYCHVHDPHGVFRQQQEARRRGAMAPIARRDAPGVTIIVIGSPEDATGWVERLARLDLPRG